MSNLPTDATPTHGAVGSNFEARILAGIHCPHCSREVRASDVIIPATKKGTEITCGGCHQRLVLIEPVVAEEGVMKISVNAGELATALALAASLSGDKVHRFLDVVRLSAAGDTLTITADVFDFMLTLTVPASVATAGEMAVLASRLAALAAGFDTEVLIEISSAETVAHIGCGRSRFRLPTIPMQGLPVLLALTEATGSVTVDRDDAARAAGMAGLRRLERARNPRDPCRRLSLP